MSFFKFNILRNHNSLVAWKLKYSLDLFELDDKGQLTKILLNNKKLKVGSTERRFVMLYFARRIKYHVVSFGEKTKMENNKKQLSNSSSSDFF